MKTASLPETEGRELLSAGFATILRLCQTCVNSPSTASSQLLASSVALIKSLSEATSHSGELLHVRWNPRDWTDSVVRSLFTSPATPVTFSLHAALIRSMLTLVKTPTLRPAFVRDSREVIEALTTKVSLLSSLFFSSPR